MEGMFILYAMIGLHGGDDHTLGMREENRKKKKMENMFILYAMNGLHGGDDRTLRMREEN